MKKIVYIIFVALLTAVTGPVCGQHTLGNIPEGWKVEANGDSVPVVNGTATITDGATVVLTPPYPAFVKSVKLVDDSPLSGKFSVSATKQVYFSRGNLQATTSDLGESWTWSLAKNQWDYIGNTESNTSINGNGTVSVNGTVDLFGWVGASSTWEGAAKYGISKSTDIGLGTEDGYGNAADEALKSDWGNTIGTGWRTLTREEWMYLMEHHTKGWSTVNGVNGYVIRPDSDSTAIAASYTATGWAAEEDAGSVFLPATGFRQGTEVNNVGSHGNYWSSSPNTSDVRFAYRLYFSDSNLDPQSSYSRFFGYPVRLVKDADSSGDEPAPTTSCRLIDLDTLQHDLVAQDCDTLTNALNGNYKISIADGATVTLRDATINGVNNDSYSWAGITCLGNATIILEGTNTVKGFYVDYPGVQAGPTGSTLTIQGSGSLTASPFDGVSDNSYAAGIGCAYGIDCGNIVIEGGTIIATGGSGYGAGIGSTGSSTCGNIEINGGEVTAEGGQYSAGIGSSTDGGVSSSSCGEIIITSDVTRVTATKGSGAPNSIGAGLSGTCGTVTFGTQQMYNGAAWTTTPTSGEIYGGLKLIISNNNDTWELTCRLVDLSQITADSVMQDGDVLTGTLTANVKISIAAGATVTLDGVTINGTNNGSYKWAGITCLGDATIILKDGTTDTVKGFYEDYPGIHVPVGSTLTIQGETSGTGKLIASSNGYGAGIGGGWKISCGNIRIEDGIIEATGGYDAAGIGSVFSASCGDITITGGTIEATGGQSAAGIGSGYKASCGDITITGGVTRVTATKGADAPNSIGAGDGGSCGTVTIGGATGAITTSPYTYPAP